MFTPTLTSLLCVSVLPGLFLLLFTYFLDRVEKEPIKLLFWVFFLGFVLIPPVAMFLENLLTQTAVIALADFPLALIFFCNAVSPAIVEESMKYFVIRKEIWNHPEFNEHFDGVVYAVYVSMGFAIAENILYVFGTGMETGLVRAVLSIPGHFLFAVTMGFFFAMAKFHPKLRWFYTILSLLCPMVLHACYNGAVTCTDTESTPNLHLDIISGWVVVVVDCVLMWVLGVWCIRRMRRLSQDDAPALQQQANQAFQNTYSTEIDPAFRNPMADRPDSSYPTSQYPTSSYPTSQYPTGLYPDSPYPTSQYPAGQYPTPQHPNDAPVQKTKTRKVGCLAGLGWFILIGSMLSMFATLFSSENIERLQFEALIRKYEPIETELQNTWTQKYAQYEQNSMTDEDWVQWLKTEYLPTWMELQQELNKLSVYAKELECGRVKKLVSGRINYANEFIRAVEEHSKQIAQEAERLRIQTEYIDPVLFAINVHNTVTPSQLNEALHYAAVLGDRPVVAHDENVSFGNGVNAVFGSVDPPAGAEADNAVDPVKEHGVAVSGFIEHFAVDQDEVLRFIAGVFRAQLDLLPSGGDNALDEALAVLRGANDDYIAAFGRGEPVADLFDHASFAALQRVHHGFAVDQYRLEHERPYH